MKYNETGIEGRLSPDAYLPFLSPYLMGGYKQDDLQIAEIWVKNDEIRAHCNAPTFFQPSDGQFHLTLPLTFIMVAQLAIVYGHIDNRLERKTSEVFVHSIDLKCKRVVTNPESISFLLKLNYKRVLGHGVFYSGRINVGDGAFVGKGTFLLPISGHDAVDTQVDRVADAVRADSY